jgi:malonyl CoA-acyl carrier protein transacylase
VRWVESMSRLAALYPEARWLELGPGSTLCGLLKRIVPGVAATPLGTVADLEKWLAQ